MQWYSNAVMVLVLSTKLHSWYYTGQRCVACGFMPSRHNCVRVHGMNDADMLPALCRCGWWGVWMVCVIGCRCVACGLVWTQMVVDAGQGKEIRKKKEKRNLLGTDEWQMWLHVDALHAHGLWLQIRVLRKEKELTSADGGRNCMQTCCVVWAAVDMDEG